MMPMTDTVFPPFTVTPAAVEQLSVLGSVRLDIADGGCCGDTYEFSTEQREPTDWAFGCSGAELIVSVTAEPILRAATLDYSSRIKPPRFRIIKNPNTPDCCPCNRSFGKEWPGKRLKECRSRALMPWDEEGV